MTRPGNSPSLIAAIVLLILLCTFVQAQVLWEESDNDINNTNSGSVGIGTTDFVDQDPDGILFISGGITLEKTTAANEGSLPSIKHDSPD